jgi:hypothetical protein
MEHLKSQSTRRAILSALDALPTTVNSMYTQTLERISVEHIELVYRVLSWITYAWRPLTILELQHALTIEDNTLGEMDRDDELHDGDFLVSICAGLVQVTVTRPRVDAQGRDRCV